MCIVNSMNWWWTLSLECLNVWNEGVVHLRRIITCKEVNDGILPCDVCFLLAKYIYWQRFNLRYLTQTPYYLSGHEERSSRPHAFPHSTLKTSCLVFASRGFCAKFCGLIKLFFILVILNDWLSWPCGDFQKNNRIWPNDYLKKTHYCLRCYDVV